VSDNQPDTELIDEGDAPQSLQADTIFIHASWRQNYQN